jgi:uncharacterized membrane protein
MLGGDMKLKEFLQGAWLKHPLHPALVHVPVGTWLAALVFDLLSAAGIGGNAMMRAATYAMILGLLAALAAIPTGLADWWDIKQDKPAWKLGVLHMAFNWFASLAWAVNAGLRLSGNALQAESTPLPLLVLSFIGGICLAVSYYLGGRMVYDYGVSIARVSKEKWRKIAQEGKANLPAEKASAE